MISGERVKPIDWERTNINRPPGYERVYPTKWQIHPFTFKATKYEAIMVITADMTYELSDINIINPLSPPAMTFHGSSFCFVVN